MTIKYCIILKLVCRSQNPLLRSFSQNSNDKTKTKIIYILKHFPFLSFSNNFSLSQRQLIILQAYYYFYGFVCGLHCFSFPPWVVPSCVLLFSGLFNAMMYGNVVLLADEIKVTIVASIFIFWVRLFVFRD